MCCYSHSAHLRYMLLLLLIDMSTCSDLIITKEHLPPHRHSQSLADYLNWIFFSSSSVIKGTFDKVVWLPYNMDISISWWGYLSLKYKVISDFIGISNRILIYCWITMTFPRPFDFLDCNYNVIPLILSLFFFFFFFIVFLFISHSISFLSLFPYLTPDRISLIFFRQSLQRRSV